MPERAPSRLPVVIALLALLPCGARAQDFQLHGLLDLRAVSPADETGWDRGGLGKSRYGGDANAHLGAASLAASWQITPGLSAKADLQYQTDEHTHLDVLDAYLRYRPVSVTPWRWSVKLGAFFPPISLENDSIGWTSSWTLTPSAINGWVGEELRTVGGEFGLEHRGQAHTFTAGFAVFGKNDPAGELMGTRGWSLSDLTSGLNASVREPDVLAPVIHAPAPVEYRPFDEIDHHLGWYAYADWDSPAWGKLTVLHYDNRADPTAYENYQQRKVFAWRTRFWSFGARTRVGDVALLAQAMDGSTAFEPVPELYLDTRFRAGYLLAGWERGAWRPALRFDLFSLQQTPDTLSLPLSEHGNAITAALNWRPNDRLRLTAEWLRIDSTRDQRGLEGLDPRQIERQVQVAARVLF